jgi:hypothetical protein
VKFVLFLRSYLGLQSESILLGSRSISPEIQFPSGSSAGITNINIKPSKGKARKPTDTPQAASASGQIKLTSKLSVNSISTTTSLPSTWTVPRDNSATLVDLSALYSLPQKPNGDEYSIDALIRAEVPVHSSSPR